jgi:hypothetical protein
VWFAATVLALAAGGYLFFRHETLQQVVDRMQPQIAEIRGLDFKQPVMARRISPEEWQDFVRQELVKMPQIDHFWAVMRTVGLYRGPDLGAPIEIFGELYSLAGGAYDARADTLLLMTDMDDALLKVIIAHELYHGLQDQHFNLQRYLLDLAQNANLNADELMARQSVVEGEAAYVDAIYQARAAGMARPSRTQVAEIIRAQREWNPEQWERALDDPALSDEVREQLRLTLETRKRLPPAMLELLLSVYLDGMSFIHSLHERGWDEVAKLYSEYPPVSTEQILHPEKWLAREMPATIEWPPFDGDPRFDGWQLLTENVLGERQLQAMFRAQGHGDLAASAAAGWNGDRFAVFRYRSSDAMLLLMFTVWDTPADAQEFAAAYRLLLETKHAATSVPTRVQVHGDVVQIVEGGTEQTIDAFMRFNSARD